VLLHKTNATKTERDNNMTYTLNVAKSVGRNWDDSGETYHHYFRIVTDHLEIGAKDRQGKTLNDLVEEMQATYPSPAYNVTLTKQVMTSQSIISGIDNEVKESLSYEGLDGRVLGTPKGMTLA